MGQSRLRHHYLLCPWSFPEQWHPPEPYAWGRWLLLRKVFNEATAANPLSFVSGVLRIYGFCRQKLDHPEHRRHIMTGKCRLGTKERAEDEQGSGLRILEALRRQVSQWPSAQGISGRRICRDQV